MKKYHRLLLFIISIISVTLFLIYRHEYNRLHYVLEVFNFFGQPCNFSDFELTPSVLNHYDWGTEPLWQENQNSYIYSAFWTKEKEAKVLTLQTDSKPVDRNCYLWFEGVKKPTIGKFKFSKIVHDAETGQSAYFYYCMLVDLERIPYAVSFSAKSKKTSDLKRVLLTVIPKHNTTINTTICVLPSDFDKASLIEFISYHKLLGIDSFLFYNKDIPHRLAKIISNLSARLGYLVTFIPWNYPKNEGVLTRTFVDTDCALRNINQSQNVITLDVNEYIVPTQYNTFSVILEEFDKKHTYERLSLPVQTFCIKSTERRKPLVLQNTEVLDSKDIVVRYVYRNTNEDDVIETQAVINGVAAIHKYINCLKEPTRVYNDRSILRFATDLTRSTLVQLLLHDQI